MAGEKIRLLFPGCVHIKAHLTQEEQISIAKVAIVEDAKFYTETDPKKLNSSKTRGRIYDCVANYANGDFLTTVCVRAAQEANRIDPTIRVASPTHLLMLKYTTSAGMGYHRDDGDNDGEEDFPIVSINLGNSCVFCLKDEENVEKKIVLESGDALLFGGASRFLYHRVKKVHTKSAPEFITQLGLDARINLTFRYTPSVFGQETRFKIFDALEKVKKNRAFRDKQLIYEIHNLPGEDPVRVNLLSRQNTVEANNEP